ncbi:Uncharacterised protein [Salmonella enterica subsp. enterica]|uniref:Uncharacterized protein n=1 Tax=Salmonella enterica I TaxID=59201 RepID=A0A379WQH4_SALET|nr:Uncharacterised protein [Salmonella enterica subsp. enterica]
MAVVILKPALAATAKVFNQRAVGSGFPPEGVGKAAGRAKYLDRDVIAFSLRATDLRGIQVVRVASVIKNQAIGLSRRKAQTTPDNLLVKTN